MDAFELWYRRTHESPLDCKEIKPDNPKGNQPWIFIRKTDTEAEAPILWPSMRRANSSEKTLMLGKIEGRRRREWQGTRRLDGISDSMEMNLSKLWEMVTGHLWRTRFQFGFAGGSVVKNHAGDTVECGYDPQVRKIPWRRKWRPTPVFLPGESHEQRSLWATVHGDTKRWTQLIDRAWCFSLQRMNKHTHDMI